MNSMPNLQTVCQVISTLYDDSEDWKRRKASEYLEELQKSVYAWKIADELLHKKINLETCTFAVQTMRRKIQCSFHELPESAHISLRDSLFDHIGHLDESTSNIIVTQLSLALVDLAHQMHAWTDPISDILKRFNSPQYYSSTLEILTVYPEEVSSPSIRLGANRRNEILASLTKCSYSVMNYLNHCIAVMPPLALSIQMKVLKCLSSWMIVLVVPSDLIAESPVLHKCFCLLKDQQCGFETHEVATDCVCAALIYLEEITKHRSLAEKLSQEIFSLVHCYEMTVSCEDLDKALNFCRIFTELGESVLCAMLDVPGMESAFAQILEILMLCVGHHDYEVAAITFCFWSSLSEELYARDKSRLLDVFRPYIVRLLDAVRFHCQMEPDHDGLLNDTMFNDFRLHASELVKDVVYIIGSMECFKNMLNHLETSKHSWETIEASLFLMTAVAKNIVLDENVIVPRVFEYIFNLPENTHIAVRYSAITLIGELCEWIHSHPQVLETVLNYLLRELQFPKLGSASALALQSICSVCYDHMKPHFDGLLHIVESLDKLTYISNDAAIGLLKGTSLVLGQLPHDVLIEKMKLLCWHQARHLKDLIDKSDSVSHGSRTDPSVWLDRLAAIFRHTDPHIENGQPHPCQPVIAELWPVISDTCTKYQNDVRIMERCCRFIRFAFRRVGHNSAPLLEPLVKQILTLYQAHRHSCFLYLGSILVDEYGNQDGCQGGLLEMVQAFLGPTFALLDKPDGLRQHPDTIDDLFRLCDRFVQRAPVAFLKSLFINHIVECGMSAVLLDHKEANASALKFFSDIVSCGRSHSQKDDYETRHQLVTSLLDQYGQNLVNNLFQGYLFLLPSYMLVDIAELVFEILLFNRKVFCVWLETTLKTLPQNYSSIVTTKQLADFHKEITSAEAVKTVHNSMKDFKKLFR